MSFRILLHFMLFVEMAGGQVCLSPNSFVDFCEDQYAGAVVGGRCFFLARNQSDKSLIKTQWADAFDVCQHQGDGTALAQVYSESEMSAIWTKFSTEVTNNHPWVALRNDAIAAPGKPSISTNATHWFNAVSTYDARITVNNTCLRHRENDDNVPGDGECFVLYLNPVTNDIRYGDIGCDSVLTALCMATNSKQDFTLTPGCFMERTVQTETSLTANECATACSHQKWCRTFNYHDQAKTCDLFALHAEDASTSVKTSGFTDCYMYTAL